MVSVLRMRLTEWAANDGTKRISAQELLLEEEFVKMCVSILVCLKLHLSNRSWDSVMLLYCLINFPETLLTGPPGKLIS